MAKASFENRIVGALCGLALGDALGRPFAGLAPEEASARGGERPDEGSARLVHGAVTTWALAVLDGLLYRRLDEPLAADLALRLQVLARPLRGIALRGRPQTLAGTLAQVAGRLEKEDDFRLSGIDDVRADGLPGVLPLAFALGDSDEDVAVALVDVVTLTHRHARVVGAAAFWLGGLRHLLRHGSGARGPLLEAGAAFAAVALEAWARLRRGVLVGRPLEAEGALAMARAQAEGASSVDELLAPPGFDGRDAPERIAAAALVFAAPESGDLVETVRARAALGGEVDISAPLLVATRGLLLGKDRLPLGWLTRLFALGLIEARSRALFDERPPRLVPLVDDELRVSRWVERDDAPLALEPPPTGPRKKSEQLKLL